MNHLDDPVTQTVTDLGPSNPGVQPEAPAQLSSTLTELPEQAGEPGLQPQGVSPGLPASEPLAASSDLIPPAKPDLSGPDAGAQAHLTGIPGTLPETWCQHCKSQVKPQGKGLCPRCGRFLKLSFVARKLPVNVLRRERILKKLVADYAPNTTLLHATCEHLAGVLEQLEVMKPGSPEHQRLVTLGQTLGDTLESSRRAAVQASLTHPDAITEVRRVLVRGDGQEEPIPSYGPKSEERPLETTPRESTTATVCRYGCGSLDRCAEIKETRPEAWRALHFLDPEEVKRRNEIATQEMLHQVPRSTWRGIGKP
jgi:hypothetical protein